MTGPTPSKRDGYGVKLVRGPFLKLAPHSRHVTNPEALIALCSELRSEAPDRLLAADLFSGAGGLSLGLQEAGIDVVFSIDHYAEAVETHAHHFPGMSVDWDLSDADTVERTADIIRAAGIDLVVGGPPCQPFSKAGRSGIRHRVRRGLRDPHDERRDLWRSFVEVVRLASPRAVIMENVPDMALDTEMFILRSIVEELEQLGYAVEERVVDTWRFGVPQFRQRLILVALADRTRFAWPFESPERVTVWNAIGDLPEVEGGWRPEGGVEGYTPYCGPVTQFQKRMRMGVPAAERGRVYDHITRPVRGDDARAFEVMDSSTRYSELPEDVKRYRDDIFDDKYKRLDENDLSRTITAHIAKDGYWYIHPRQGRTLTVREAARLQSFPDWFRFAGGPSAAFKQIGNAVPPLLGVRLGEALRTSLDRADRAELTSREIAEVLATWFRKRQLVIPWLRGASRWQVMMAGILLDRATAPQIRAVWPVLSTWTNAATTLKNADLLRQIGRMTGRGARATTVLDLAERPDLSQQDQPDDDGESLPGVTKPVGQLAVLAAPLGEEDESAEPILSSGAVLRVAARFSGEPVDVRNRLTDGRLAVARMVGGGVDSREAQLALVEIGSSICRPMEPVCEECPLSPWCVEAELPQTLLATGSAQEGLNP